MSMMNITEINDGNLEEIINTHGKVIVDCYAPWCGPCRMFSEVFEELSNEEKQTKFCKINTDENPETARRFGVMSVPTVLFFENGELKHSQTGLKSKQELKSLF